MKDYGMVAGKGNKELRLQSFGEDKVALVSYKDGMRVNVLDITEEAYALKDLLEKHLGYKTEKKNDLVKTLTSLPANDCNYTLALKKATADDLNKAIKQMKESGGRHSTRIKACESALKKQELKSEQQSEKKTDCKIYQFPTPDKKPQIYQLKTDGNKTYEECEEKLNKEKETFKDADCQYVLDGLLELAKVDQNFRNNIMREDKTYAGFMEYMFKAAKDGYCIKFGDVGWLDRDLALGLAIDYYNADIEKKKKEEEEKRKKEAEQRKKGVSKNGKTNKKKKGKTA